MMSDHRRSGKRRMEPAVEPLPSDARAATAPRSLLCPAVPCGHVDISKCPAATATDWSDACAQSRTCFCPRTRAAWAIEEAENRSREQRQAERRRALESGIPERAFDLLGIGGIPPAPLMPTTAMKAVKVHDGGFLVLVGPPGTGKSIAACSWCWAKRGLFYRAAEINRMSWFQNDEIDQLSTYPNLVIDDLGAEYDNERGNWRSKLDAIINERYDRGANAATVITSNFGLSRLEEHVGERAWQRLNEAGKVVVCAGPSLRGAK